MPSLFPNQGILRDNFTTQTPLAPSKPIPESYQPREFTPQAGRFPAWSAAEDIKSKAGGLSDEARKEIAKASSAAQAKTGTMELYSAQYYAACTFGGLVACVSTSSLSKGVTAVDEKYLGCHTHRCHTFRLGQMPSASRSEAVQGQL